MPAVTQPRPLSCHAFTRRVQEPYIVVTPVRGPTVFGGYHRAPQQTHADFREGWFRTGDLATVDAKGYLAIRDRAKDMVLCGGENVYSVEVQNALYGKEVAARSKEFDAWSKEVSVWSKKLRLERESYRPGCKRTHRRARMVGDALPRVPCSGTSCPRPGSPSSREHIVLLRQCV
eukprot:1189836-Prorocentrum_minimum.AAC.8